MLKIIFYILISISPLLLQAQKNKSQLEREKEENLAKIQETNKILLETKSKKKATLGQLTAIKQQINAQTRLINSISSEISVIDREMAEAEDVINALENDLSLLKKEYSAMVYAASKSTNYYDKLTFIFSSRTFNQLVMRIKYFKQYSEARKHQLKQIQMVKSSIANQKVKLNQKRQEKAALLGSKTVETHNLTEMKTQQDKVVQELSNKEKELKRELDERKKSVKKLEKLITDLIAEERAKAAKESMAKTGTVKSTPEAIQLSNSFSGNMSRLPWPVAHGNISHHFGKQAHPVLKGVYVDNLGVDIQTLKNEPVRAVFQGKVITVASVPGMNNVVMIQHGDFFTVYAKLKNVHVKTGDEVKSKDVIGEVYTDKNDVSELQFQIWENSIKHDPEKWLSHK
ncbi:MAG TPA: peptidoglycan DD-metalloendopeptidase family protein [Cytophagaceae bacterium]|jgi:septal ring factor EnvC (AmiA/AmiB activator)